MCSSRTTFNETSKRCEPNENVRIITNLDVVRGTKEVNKGENDVFKDPIFTDSNAIELKTTVKSKNSYIIRFFFLYKVEFVALVIVSGP